MTEQQPVTEAGPGKPGPTSDKRKSGNAGPAKGAGNPNAKGGKKK